MKSLQKISEALTRELEQLQKRIEHRESIFDNRSETWQEDERGEAFLDRTEELQQCSEDLENAIDQLNDLIEG